jgi:hypothetical protein
MIRRNFRSSKARNQKPPLVQNEALLGQLALLRR